MVADLNPEMRERPRRSTGSASVDEHGHPIGQHRDADDRPAGERGRVRALAGFNALVLPKGRDGKLNENDTQLEFVSQTNLVLDVGQWLENTFNRVEAFVGLQYWNNKFGGDPGRTPNTQEKALIAGIADHLN